jgi:hypothetical protein
LPERHRDLLALSAALLLGIAAFFAFCGWWVLIPTNIAWLDVGDRAMHQLGWMYYRAGPWGIPPGASPRLGIELANSIALVDGLPLLAIPFKLIEQWLPQPFQYWGYWLLLSFMLQSAFAFRIAREVGAGRRVALVAAGFALIAPAYLYRIPMHLALSSHWVVLAALFLYVRRVPPGLWMWPLLIGVTSAIHATLLAMVLALWGASLLQRLWTRRTPFLRLLIEVFLGLALGIAILWIVGFFGTDSYTSYGYGNYRLNLLWPIISYGWSQIFPDLPHARFDYEGLSFLGIGILALLVLAVLSGAMAQLRQALTLHWLPLVLVTVGMMVFAFSKTIGVLDVDLFTIPMPGFIEALGSAFRSTGRFVWPLLYLVTIGAVVLVGQRWRPALSLPIVLVAFVAQAADSYPKWHEFADRMKPPAPTWNIELESEFWERAASAGYNRIRSIPIDIGFGSDWKNIGYFAFTHGMDTDVAYLGRTDEDAEQALRLHALEVLTSGAFEPKTIYILNDVRSALAAAKHAGPADLLARFDNRTVFVRNGRRLAEGLDAFPVWPAD